MIRSRIFFFILFNLLHHINGLQRSDWSYDAKIDTVTMTSNGKSYFCSPWNIIGSITIRYYDSMSTPCLHRWRGYGSSCMTDEFLRILSKSIPKVENEIFCNYIPLPAAEDTLRRIEKVYESSSLDDNPATRQWYDQVLQNLTRMENDCRETGTSLLPTEKVNFIREKALSAYTIGRGRLPELMNSVSDAFTAFNEVLPSGMDVRSLSSLATFPGERRDRERLLAMELAALQDNEETALNTWYTLAQLRTDFVRKVFFNMKTESSDGSLSSSEVWMKNLSLMAQANEVLAYIQDIVKDVSSIVKLVCPLH